MKYNKEIEDVLCLINNAQDKLNELLAANIIESETLVNNVTNYNLAPQMNFQNFIEGYSNRIALKTGLAIAEHFGENTFTPFYVYGPFGCGKSHLINAIGLLFYKICPQKTVYYVSARQFQKQYTESVCQKTTNDFIKFYHLADVLIIDDIQEWLTDSKSLEVFHDIFNHLLRKSKQLILASDCPPVELQDMGNSLLSLFSSGIVVEIESPDMQLCIDFLNAKFQNNELKIPVNIIEFIAKTANGNLCNLEGIVNSLKAYSIVNNSNIDMNLAKRIVGRSIKMD